MKPVIKLGPVTIGLLIGLLDRLIGHRGLQAAIRCYPDAPMSRFPWASRLRQRHRANVSAFNDMAFKGIRPPPARKPPPHLRTAHVTRGDHRPARAMNPQTVRSFAEALARFRHQLIAYKNGVRPAPRAKKLLGRAPMRRKNCECVLYMFSQSDRIKEIDFGTDMRPSDPLITCPNCGYDVKLTESLAAPMIADMRKADAEKLRVRDEAFATREARLKDAVEALEAGRADMNAVVAQKMAAQRKAIQEAEQAKAQQAAMREITAQKNEVNQLQTLLKDSDAKVEAAQKKELEVRKKERELVDAQRELELTLEKRVQASLGAAQTKARAEAEAALGLRVIEKQEKIESMARTIEDLNRKMAQGSQQSQGEALEVALETRLAQKFIYDRIDPVKKGESGADTLQTVINPMGAECGRILWETKRTKNWNAEWLVKLRGDQRAAKAEIAVLVSASLPAGVASFSFIDGVWVVGIAYFEALAGVLRQGLIDVQGVKRSQQGQQTKTEKVYDYLTGPQFRQRVEAIVENFTAMQADLNRERKAMTRLWAKREKQIQGVIDSTVGMHGELQGIAGEEAMQEIDGLESDLLLLEDDGEEV